jgi:hypothetical protein
MREPDADAEPERKVERGRAAGMVASWFGEPFNR